MFLQISNNFLETHEILRVYVNNDDKLLLEENHSLKPVKIMQNLTTTKPQQSNGFQGLGWGMTLSVSRPVVPNLGGARGFQGGMSHKREINL
jgi:hypothetical protein